MQRRARTYAASAALVAALTGGLAACTGDSSSGGSDGDPDPGTTSSAPSAAPGKYSTLPEPCGAVTQDTLKDLLPGAGAEDSGSAGSSPSASPYDGRPAVTYDTDRRVGCTWKSATTLGSRHLTVTFDRAVSYDPAVSDDSRAELLYDEQAGKADIPASSEPTDSPSPTESDPPADGQNGKGPADGSGSKGGDKSGDKGGDKSKGGTGHTSTKGGAKGDTPSGKDSGSPDDDSAGDLASASPTPEGELAPRTLDGIGDAAFINDKLVTTEHSRTAHRDVTLVFRTANVLVTVEYSQSVADEHRTPDSKELQDKAQSLAQQLTGRFDDS